MESSHTILLIDDELSNLSLLFEALNRQGFDVLVSQNGETALSQAEEEQPDLILLDIMMPKMDGFETCRRLKANPFTRDIPVLFLTALPDTVSKVKGFDVGGVDYITKPLQPEDVLARIRTHITIREQQQQLQAQHTQLREQYAVIEQQRAQLEELNASKDKFFSIIAHDLKNPLIAFLSGISLLQDNQLTLDHSGKKENVVEQLSSIAKNLYALLENLLLWARMQHGGLTPNLCDTNIQYIIYKNVELLKPMAANKQITLTNTISTPLSLYADADMVDTIIRNLLTNAMKFTPEGGTVTISAFKKEDTADILISDTGIGIKPEVIPILFRIDSRHHKQGTQGERGTGLGLILCQEFAEQNNGTIQIESDIGQGTTCRVTLPTHK